MGGFSVSIMGNSWHSVGLDESHEMLINRDCKSAVIHPTKEFVSRMAIYFPFRSKVLKNLQQQINPDRDPADITLTEVSTSQSKKLSNNTWTMKTHLESGQLLATNESDANHVRKGKTLIFSPDTDVYHIGLTYVDIGQSDIIVHLSAIGRDLKLLHMNSLMVALSSDPSLSSIPPNSHPSMLQMLYLYFIVSLGKSANPFFRLHNGFQATPMQTLQSLAFANPENNSFLAFVRIVGAAYTTLSGELSKKSHHVFT